MPDKNLYVKLNVFFKLFTFMYISKPHSKKQQVNIQAASIKQFSMNPMIKVYFI